MGGGAWWATVHGVAKSQTWLSNFTFTFHFQALEKEMATHSSVLAWRIPETGETGRLPSMGSHRVGHDWHDLAAAAQDTWFCGSTSGYIPAILHLGGLQTPIFTTPNPQPCETTGNPLTFQSLRHWFWNCQLILLREKIAPNVWSWLLDFLLIWILALQILTLLVVSDVQTHF